MNFFVRVVLITCNLMLTCRAQCYYDPNVQFDKISDTTDAFNTCIFDTTNLSPKCINEHCPKIRKSRICPLNEDRRMNITKVIKINGYITDCFKKTKTICGIPVTKLPIPVIRFDMAEAIGKIPFLAINCTTRHNKNKWVVSNFTKAKIEIFNTSTEYNNNYIHINTRVDDMHFLGSMSCNISLVKEKLLSYTGEDFTQRPDFLEISRALDEGKIWSRKRVGLQININFTTNSLVNINRLSPKPLARSKILVQISLTGLIPESISTLLEDLNPLQSIQSGIQYFWEMDRIARIYSDFLNIYTAYAFQIALENCPRRTITDEL